MDASDGCSHSCPWPSSDPTSPSLYIRLGLIIYRRPLTTNRGLAKSKKDNRDTKDTTSFCASILESHKGNEVQPGRVRTAAQAHFQSISQFPSLLPAKGSDDALSSSFTEGVNLVVDRMVG